MSDELNNANLPAIAQSPPNSKQALSNFLGEQQVTNIQSWCSFVPDTPHERRSYYAALDGETLAFDKLIGQDLDLVNFAFSQATVTDKESGEVISGIRVCLFLADGRIASGMSMGIRNSLVRLIQSGFWPAKTDPIKCRLIQLSIPDSKRMYRLEYISGGDGTTSTASGDKTPRKK